MVAEKIDPTAWRVRIQLVHEGITYGPADPLPEISVEDALKYEAQGHMVRLSPDGTAEAHQYDRPEPRDAENYLMAKDELVLRSILEHKPDLAVIKEMLKLAKVNARSVGLQCALEAIITYGDRKRPRSK